MENLFHCLINNSSLLLAIIVFSAIYFIITYCNIWEKSEKNKTGKEKSKPVFLYHEQSKKIIRDRFYYFQ